MPTFLLRRANYRALLGDGGADGDVQRVLAEPTWKDRHKNATDLLKWMRAAPRQRRCGGLRRAARRQPSRGGAAVGRRGRGV